MNPFIKKEIRLLLPAWIAAILLAIVPVWFASIWSDASNLFMSVIGQLLIIGFLFLGISTFGQEISSGLFAGLLSLPMERRRIWVIKTTTLGIAFSLILLAWAVSVKARNACTNIPIPFLPNFEILLLSTIAIFSGGLWTTLLLRQTVGAFWFTLLIPLSFSFVITTLLESFGVSESTANRVIAFLLIGYSIAGFLLARRLFFAAQDTQWTGGHITFQWSRKVPTANLASISAGPRHWLSALVLKEIQLHQANVLIAIIILSLNLLSLFVRRIHPVFQNRDLQFGLEAIWILWLFMPLLIGCSAVAEERRLGILESQLCLPVSRRGQFFTKFSTALVLSLFFGGVMPLLIEGTKFFNGWIFAGAGAIFIISFYASSPARTTPQALGLAIVVAAAIAAFQAATSTDIMTFGQFAPTSSIGLALLRLYLGVPILLLVFGWLAFWNFKWLHQYGKCFRRNTIVIICAFFLILILPCSIYFRAWELLSPIEPPHGPALLSNSSEVKFLASYNTLYTRLPDGRAWVEALATDYVTNRWQRFDVLAPARSHAQFIAGSNWDDITADSFQALGIKSDGTLWSLQRKWNPSRNHWFQTGPFIVTQIGSDTDWSQAASGSMGFLLTKKDGSLWLWGIHGYDWRSRSISIPKKLKLDLATLPSRIGNETDWTTLFSASDGQSPRVMKSDGTLWRWTGWNGTNFSHVLTLEADVNGPWSSLANLGDYFYEGIKTNGSLWIIRTIESGVNRNKIERHVEEQIGKDAQWKSVGSHWGAVYAIRDDGTLWRWSSVWNLSHSLSEPVQLGKQSDWIVSGTTWSGSYSLAADGSIWVWDQPSRHIWLAPSRKPVYVGNIFQGAPADQ